MLKLPASAEYGLLAVVDLAGAHATGELIKASDVAGRQGIPLPYLERLLAQLRTAGIVESFRGPSGGHRLSRAPGVLRAVDVLSALVGPVSAPGEGRLRFLWERCSQALSEALDVSIADIAEQLAAREGSSTYQI